MEAGPAVGPELDLSNTKANADRFVPLEPKRRSRPSGVVYLRSPDAAEPDT